MKISSKGIALFSIVSIAFNTALYSQSIYTYAGNGLSGNSGDGGLAVNAAISTGGICIDNSGNTYLSSGYQIRKINSSGVITTIAGTGVSGYSGDGGSALNAQLSGPRGLTIDILGNIYFADQGNNVIRKIDANGIITTYGGNGSNGYSGDGGLAINAKMNSPIGVALDSQGNLYATELSHRIRKISITGTITTYAGTGTAGFNGDGALASNTQLSSPNGIAVDQAGNVYIADSGNQRIRKVDLTTGTVITVVGNGLGGFSGDGGPATSAALSGPIGITFDTAGNLYFADNSNQRVRKVDVNGIISTYAGNGTSGYSGDFGPATNAQLAQPTGVAINVIGSLFIIGNNRIREVCNTNCFVGVNETNQLNNEILVFPNPTNGKVTIKMNHSFDNLQVFNLLGSEILNTKIDINHQSIDLDLSMFNEGTYILSTNSSNGVFKRKIFIRP
jgi:sugar lactone lactonase YvrE